MEELSSKLTYMPPSPDILEHFAFEVCQGLGADFAQPDIVYGLASFLKAVAQAHAKALNRKPNGLVDQAAR